MMLAWSFAARTVDEIARLLRSLGKHRYVREVDHRLHWSVDHALAELPEFAPHAAAFDARLGKERGLELGSRDPSLWREARTEEVIAALTAFWTPGEEALRYRTRLLEALARTGLPEAAHAPFASPPNDPPHPELVLLDWELYPVDELDADRHAGALAAMEEAEEEVNASAPVYNEGPIIAAPELCDGAPDGMLADDFLVWSDGPYSYSDYVFRGVARAAKLEEPPTGYKDL
ncbi:hypothetical protein WMF31_39745 [Sorangium sp. So ce1036]|uniref:hypothetical protein n=1 Tax=Sorangium sp. So ce1036 TaxID=3133328 RepID=UPI003F04AAC6